jgi:hypothetical protein
MPRVDRRRIEKIEEQLKGDKHIELVVINDENGEVILRKQTGTRISSRLVVRI